MEVEESVNIILSLAVLVESICTQIVDQSWGYCSVFSIVAQEERSKVDDLRGTPMAVGNLEEIIDDNHAIVSTSVGSEYYVNIMSFVDKDLLEPGCTVLLNHKYHSVVGVLTDDTDPMVSVMKLEKAPKETYADIGGLDPQIQEIKVKFKLTHLALADE